MPDGSNVPRETPSLHIKLAKALAREGTHTPLDVKEAIDRQEMQDWTLGESIVITSIQVYPRLKACEVFCAAGNMDEIWRIIDEQIEPWAKSLGCQRCMSGGRYGWLDSAKNRGWVVSGLKMRKEIT